MSTRYMYMPVEKHIFVTYVFKKNMFTSEYFHFLSIVCVDIEIILPTNL